MNNMHNGFTLIELLVSFLLISVIGFGIVGLQFIVNRNQLTSFQNYLTVDEANNSLAVVTREIRNTRYGDNGAYPLEVTNDNEIVFYSDIDYDNQTERVRYFRQGDTLYKAVIEPSGYPVSYPGANEKLATVTENIRNTQQLFYYYNGDWPVDTVNNPLSANRLSATKLIKTVVEINLKENEQNKNYLLESYAQIRMLKENL